MEQIDFTNIDVRCGEFITEPRLHFNWNAIKMELYDDGKIYAFKTMADLNVFDKRMIENLASVIGHNFTEPSYYVWLNETISNVFNKLSVSNDHRFIELNIEEFKDDFEFDKDDDMYEQMIEAMDLNCYYYLHYECL